MYCLHLCQQSQTFGLNFGPGICKRTISNVNKQSRYKYFQVLSVSLCLIAVESMILSSLKKPKV